MSDSKRTTPTWLLPAGLFALVVVLVVVALSREPASLDPASPEGVVQDYLQAIRDQRFDDALAAIHPDWLGDCTTSDMAEYVDTDFTAKLATDESFEGVVGERFEDIGDSLDGVSAPEPTESVDVTISHNAGSGLGSTWSEDVRFDLTDDSGEWLLAVDPWPYFTWSCREG